MLVNPHLAFASYFNPRIHVGCDYLCKLTTTITNRFQSTHPRGMRLDLLKIKTHCLKFQSTHPRGMRPIMTLTLRIRSQFQSTHPRGMRHVSCNQFFYVPAISIHASTWDATGADFAKVVTKKISIHASTWDATLVPASIGGFTIRISIHASTWDATCERMVRALGHKISIHASTWDATLNQPLTMLLNLEFQSTHPRGMRPRPQRYTWDGMAISIHASTWDATICLLK